MSTLKEAIEQETMRIDEEEEFIKPEKDELLQAMAKLLVILLKRNTGIDLEKPSSSRLERFMGKMMIPYSS